jgi:hypothetical protein
MRAWPRLTRVPQYRHKTPRGFWIGNVPADALLYDQNVLDWTLVGELTGDRQYMGRGFVPSARGLTDWERKFIEWTYDPAPKPSPLNGMTGGTYDREYTLRYLTYGTQDSSRADLATVKARSEATAKAGSERPKAYGCGSCSRDVGRGGGGSHTIERMIKAPPWLFSAESDVYKNAKQAKRSPGIRGGDRVLARYWSATPPPTALAHFVCTRWPGSDGRKIGMRLLRKWFVEDIVWVRQPTAAATRTARTRTTGTGTGTSTGAAVNSAAFDAARLAAGSAAMDRGMPRPVPPGPAGRKSASPLVAFASPLPLGDAQREPAARCAVQPTGSYKAASPCASRWRPARALPWDRQMLETWHKLLALLSVITQRRAVIPLFECAGILDPRGRFSWTLYAAPPPPPPPSTSAMPVKPTKNSGRRRALSSLFRRSAARHQQNQGSFYPNNPTLERTACAFRLGEGCFSKLGFPEEIARLPASERLHLTVPTDLFRAGGVPALLQLIRNTTGSHAGSDKAPAGLLVDLQMVARELSEDAIRAHVDRFVAQSRPDTWLSKGAHAAASASTIPFPKRFLGLGRQLEELPVGGASRLVARGHGPATGRGRHFGKGGGRGSGRGTIANSASTPHGMSGWRNFIHPPGPSWTFLMGQATCFAFARFTGQPYVC